MTNNEIKTQIALGTLDIGRDLNPEIVKEIDDEETVNMVAQLWIGTDFSNGVYSTLWRWNKTPKEFVNYVDVGTILLQHKFVDERLKKIIDGDREYLLTFLTT